MMTYLPIIVVLTGLLALAWRNQLARNPEKNSPGEQALAQQQRRRK